MLRYGGVGVVLMMGLAMASLVQVYAGIYNPALKQGFYNGKCIQKSRQSLFHDLFPSHRTSGIPVDVEEIVWRYVSREYVRTRGSIVPALLRMQFHDCFVNGCDASLLLDGPTSEKQTPPNLSVRGFELIDAIKADLEFRCPGVVSCADIVAIATRDAVYLGSRTRARSYNYPVETGRRDGLASGIANVFDLPPPPASVDQALAMFAKKGLNAFDLVYLLIGGHSVGITHCQFIQDRIDNATATPPMNPRLRRSLKAYCNNPNKPISLDQGTSNYVDTSLSRQISFGNGILRADQEINSHPQTKSFVEAIKANSDFVFGINFGRTMIKMQSIGVLTGPTNGQIRSSCRAVKTF